MRGKIHVVGDNISADHIIAAKYINKVAGIKEMLPYLLEEVSPGLAEHIQPGDILVAGDNFGSGSSREHAPLLLKESGLSCVIAKSFGRNFFRNAINIGLPLAEVQWNKMNSGDIVEVSFSAGQICNKTTNESFNFPNLPAIMEKILASGGLIPYFQKHKSLLL